MKGIDLAGSTRRLSQWIALTTLCGSIAAGVYGGQEWITGFLTGAAFSSLNFFLWHRLVSRVGESQGAGGPVSSGYAVSFAFRYAVFAVVGYVIVKSFGASILAALAGCFVAVAAVLLEILFELIYGT